METRTVESRTVESRTVETRAPDDAMALRATLDTMRGRFLASVAGIRPRLHRFCSRTCGSVLDGEDVVQETLAQAFYSLGSLQDADRLEPWLFRIAHHKCVDFLRRERHHREDTVPFADEHDLAPSPDAPLDGDAPIDAALATLLIELPPKERASVLLKDVLTYPLADVAEIIDSTVGGVKAALHRGRAKLRASRIGSTVRQPALDSEERRLLEAYADCFNRRDWDALRRLIEGDARLELVGVTAGTMRDVGRNYFGNYVALPRTWRFALARVDGEPMLVHWERADDTWHPLAAVRLSWRDGRVVQIRDYVHVDYLLRDAHTELEV
jgi:RNA polymerase sigma-70 factor, ECF subfamily